LSALSKPWLSSYGAVPASLEYPRISLYEALARSARKRSSAVALDFLGTRLSYDELLAAVDRCAAAFAHLGLGRGERITIALPTCPQGVIAFYAAARLGAVSSMIHPLSTTDEIVGYLTRSESRVALTLDAFYSSFAEAADRVGLETLLLARVPDYLRIDRRLGFWWTRGRKLPAVPNDRRVHWWAELMSDQHPTAEPVATGGDELATILYSGGSTGTPKGIMLSHHNLISEGMQVASWVKLDVADTALAVLPIFHGFGLAALINAPLITGAKAILVPQYSPAIVAELLRTKRPTIIAGPPTLYDSLGRDASLQTADLSSVRVAFCGADTLPEPVRVRFEQLIAKRGGKAPLLEGYGLTEAVTAVLGMPLHERRTGSVGIPFPDMLAGIFEVGATTETRAGEEGEICLSGPAVMLGYLDDPEATAETLREHEDGRTWLRSGDLGRMDSDGFFYITGRLKRMIKTSGYNVYPAQVEAVLYRHPEVAEACVIGIPDERLGERVKAFVVTKRPSDATDALEHELIRHCRDHLIKWSCPRAIEFRTELPKTRVGKVDFTALAAESAPGGDSI
jgi:long-chain acyl-CoA synthetase